MAINISEIVMLAVGFVLIVILTPIGMAQIGAAVTTNWNSAVITMFDVLLPVLYIVGAAVYMIPKIGD